MTSPVPPTFTYKPSGGSPATGTPAGGGGQFPTIVPSSFQKYATTNVPGLDYPNPGLVPPGTVGSHSNVVSTPNARHGGATLGTSLGSALDTLLHSKDPNSILSIQRELIKAGYLDPHDSHGFIAGSVSSSDATYYAYARAMSDAIEKQQNFHKLINGLIKNPRNTLGQGYWSTFQQDQDAAKNGGATSVTSTDVSNNLTSATDARAAAQNEFQSLLGRNVNDKEAQAFYGALDAFEKANPNVTTSTQNYDAQGHGTGSNSTTVGGSNADQFAQSYVMQNNPSEYAQTQGEQVYNLFANLIGGSA